MVQVLSADVRTPQESVTFGTQVALDGATVRLEWDEAHTEYEILASVERILLALVASTLP